MFSSGLSVNLLIYDVIVLFMFLLIFKIHRRTGAFIAPYRDIAWMRRRIHCSETMKGLKYRQYKHSVINFIVSILLKKESEKSVLPH